MSKLDSFLKYARTCEENGHMEEALAWYKKACSIKGDDERILWNIAYILQEQGDYDGAAKWYGRILEYYPGHFAATYNLAKANYELKRYREAKALYQKYLTLVDPEDELVGCAKILINACICNLAENDPTKGKGFVKLYPHNKVTFTITGPAEYISLAEECIKNGAADTCVSFDKNVFREKMKEKNVPDDCIDELIEGVYMSDDTYLVPNTYD